MKNNWKNIGQQWVYNLINPFINLLIKLGITPNFITFIGLIINILATVVFIRLARVGKQESKYGAIFDSVLDRYSEMIMFLGICYYLIGHSYFLSSLFAFIGMIGSIMVSYTRARAEGMGLKMSDIGFMQRPERILLIGISGLACGITSHFIGSDYKVIVNWLPFPLFETITIFTFPIFILAVLANITAVKRLLAARNLLNQS